MNIDIVQGLLVGLVVGLGLALIIVKMRGGNDSAAIKKLEEEHEKYRQEVDSHFVKTAGLFKGLTDQYRDVYKHMAEGADELCSEEVKTLQSDLAATGLLTQVDDVVADAATSETESVPDKATTDKINKVEEKVADVEPAKDHVEVVADKSAEKGTEKVTEEKVTEAEPAKDHVEVVDEKSVEKKAEKINEKAVEEKTTSSEEDFPLASEVEIPSELAEEKKK